MSSNKLIVCIMGQNCEKFLPMCLESVKDADKRIYVDGGSKDRSIFIAADKAETIVNLYNQEDKAMNGKQRNFYLNFLKNNYPNDWALCLDADEVVEDLSKIKEFIQEAQPGLYSVKMRHFIGDLGHEDAVSKEHFALNRLFKINEAGSYPEVEHPVLTGEHSFYYRGTTIWHLSYIPNLWDLKNKYDNHLKKSNMHSPEYLRNWYYAHLFGRYPVSELLLTDIPEIILKEFGIDKDEFYFQNRGLEVKHFLMMKNYLDKFKEMEMATGCLNPRVLEYGAGFGPFGIAAQTLGCIYEGIDLSDYAIKKNPFNVKLTKGDIRTDKGIPADIVLCIDVLEHLKEEDLDKALKNIQEYGALHIFSIPFLGDPNLELDKTHKIKKSKEWWIGKLINSGFKIKPAPENWLFHEQILVGEL